MWKLCTFVFLTLLSAQFVQAQNAGSVTGVVIDPLGARVQAATVTLLREGSRSSETTTNERGEFAFPTPASGRYQVRVNAQGFASKTTDPFFAGASGQTAVEIALTIGTIEQTTVVTATATEISPSRVGAQVTVLDALTLDDLAKTEVSEALRLVPGSTVSNAGQRGGVSSFFVRGGTSNFNKVLVDGVPVNDLGGGFDFSDLSVTGIERLEVLRESNSVLYGADSLTGVVSFTTSRGRTETPDVVFAIDGGNLSTFHNDLSVGGVRGRFDYFAAYSFFRTDNDLPNNEFEIGTFAARVGARVGTRTDLSATIRRVDRTYGSPNAFDYYLIADDAEQEGDATYFGLAANSRISDRLRSTIQFSTMRHRSDFTNFSPDGIFFPDFGTYLGEPVTIRGANGYEVSGQAVLEFGGDYPTLSESRASRELLAGHVTYDLAPGIDVSAGGRFEHEEGLNAFTGFPSTEATRWNQGLFLEGHASAGRLHVTGGVAYDHNDSFASAFSPRVSVAAYLRQPMANEQIGDTKLVFNAGKGIKAPSIFQENGSLYALLTPEQADALNVGPIDPEQARTVDFGVEQGLWNNQLRLRAIYFDNNFTDLIEFVSSSFFPQAGISKDVAAAVGGANVNSQSFKARGLELSGDAALAHFRFSASYTHLDAEVTKSFASGALSPATNPEFPGVPIGAFAPLVGGRPFRRPAHAGNLLVTYVQPSWRLTVAGYFAGKSDDSTFLTDQFFGNSLLLPNRDMQAGYQKFDVSGSYNLYRRIKWYASIENIGGEDYQSAAGYPALGRTFRTGVSLGLGGR